jgi:hypothetical protein
MRDSEKWCPACDQMPIPTNGFLCADCTAAFEGIPDLLARAERAEARAKRLAGALKALTARLDDGTLVRNTDDDGAADWTMRMLSFVQELSAARAALAE